MRPRSTATRLRTSPLGLILGLLACGTDPPVTDSLGDTGTSTSQTTGVQPTGGCSIGAEGCACTTGGGCDPGLVCLSMLCVDPGAPTTTTTTTDTTDSPGSTTTTDATTTTTDATTTSATTTGSTTTTDGTDSTSTTGGMGNWDEDYPSCQDLAQDACGGDNCCATDAVPGGWFAMGRGEQPGCPDPPNAGDACAQTADTCFDSGETWGCPTGTWIALGGDDAAAGGADEIPEHAARVAFHGLDRYEVTVGRMRRFVDNYDKASLLTLLDGGAGTHPALPATAWDNAWDGQLSADVAALQDALACNAIQTWTDDPGNNETFPINCASWYLAYAFCAWDEGRLPIEAEWERAASGGDENRLYPWGTDAPSATLANYSATDNTPEADVFAKPDGAGRWGHVQLAGSVWEWVFDTHDPGWYAGPGHDCQDCANTTAGGAKIMRGGDFQYNAISLRGAERFPGTASAYWLGAGIRCARD
jgi:formylglycine-generating enzyme